ncbi:hypothetical protein BDM02DRAFT_3115976 [Thelephora ganbajun]|uniref:Uncharacterized protein n=1 Tax=Thelephora ganbajun TaxID=370292 RepID=A0ACB6ZF60_THEGA|nr:hypothetical protein BDM02DRAFT_3115976 [Thelephora ganbajun]
MTFGVDAGFHRRDGYKKYKRELDVLYALGEPQPEKMAKLSSLIPLDWVFRRECWLESEKKR